MIYIATFYSHFGAIRFRKLCLEQSISAEIMPVPRNLSSSCGSCVRYEGALPCPVPQYPEEVEQVVAVTDRGYQCLYRAENG